MKRAATRARNWSANFWNIRLLNRRRRNLASWKTSAGRFTRQISDYYLSDLDAEDLDIDSFSANLYDLLSAFQTVLSKTSNEAMHDVYEQVVTIEEKMSEIRTRLLEKKRMVFSELFQNGWTRNLLVITFLAVLEIVRTKMARVMQDKQFGEIYIEQI